MLCAAAAAILSLLLHAHTGLAMGFQHGGPSHASAPSHSSGGSHFSAPQQHMSQQTRSGFSPYTGSNHAQESRYQGGYSNGTMQRPSYHSPYQGQQTYTGRTGSEIRGQETRSGRPAMYPENNLRQNSQRQVDQAPGASFSRNYPNGRTYQPQNSFPSQTRVPGQTSGSPMAPYTTTRPNYGGSPGGSYQNPGIGPGRNGSAYYGGSPAYEGSPAGHLGDWLSQHSTNTQQQREQLLRQQPGFSHLNQSDQQRLMGQMHTLNQMPADQRARRLARTEMIEHLSPGERSQVSDASREYRAMPADRQSQMKRAFQDLRGVPLDQRQTMLNSGRYQSTFSPQERTILNNLLRVEPYEPAR